jgi:hypothetical protein
MHPARNPPMRRSTSQDNLYSHCSDAESIPNPPPASRLTSELAAKPKLFPKQLYQYTPFANRASQRCANTSLARATAIRASVLDPSCLAPTATYWLGSLAHASSWAWVVKSRYGTSMHTEYWPREATGTLSITP